MNPTQITQPPATTRDCKTQSRPISELIDRPREVSFQPHRVVGGGKKVSSRLRRRVTEVKRFPSSSVEGLMEVKRFPSSSVEGLMEVKRFPSSSVEGLMEVKRFPSSSVEGLTEVKRFPSSSVEGLMEPGTFFPEPVEGFFLPPKVNRINHGDAKGHVRGSETHTFRERHPARETHAPVSGRMPDTAGWKPALPRTLLLGWLTFPPSTELPMNRIHHGDAKGHVPGSAGFQPVLAGILPGSETHAFRERHPARETHAPVSGNLEGGHR